ncbi:MAG: hypothetical protein L0K86_15455, partial [Actinomycetia bacterium]|nr:hypothetical protein [Actinomycetes bacterium]
VLVAEGDPIGGDAAARMPAAEGGVLDPERGLVSLSAAGRKSLHPDLVLQHAQTVVGGLDVLAGVRVPEQAVALNQQWAQFGPLFAGLEGRDVIADLGRIGATTPQIALLESTSDLLFVVDTQPSSVMHMRERLRSIANRFEPPRGPRLHVVVVAEIKRRQPVREIGEVLERSDVEVAGVHHLAEDPKGALFFAGQIDGRPDRTNLIRTARPIVAEVAAATAPFFRPVAADEGGVSDEGAAIGVRTVTEEPSSRGERATSARGDR